MVFRSAWFGLRRRFGRFGQSPASKSPWRTFRERYPRVAEYSYYAFMFTACIPFVISVNDNLFETATVTGPSMYPFFNAEKDQTTRGDTVLNFKYNAQYSLQRGMIVTFWSPHRPDAMAVKRIIGLPGDVIRTRTPYSVPIVTVPPGHIWVEGDGEDRDTFDSNSYGPISTGLIIGRVTHILLPLHRAGRVRWWEHAEKIRKE
ncbi:LexA/Signal peptidase [Xylariaceae sp. FL1019]|nr:LexA/Signal peptidase [Xylariaceae sp. FL1019]